MCLYLLQYRTHLDIVPTDIGNTEVAPGGSLDLCLRFLYEVKIVKMFSMFLCINFCLSEIIFLSFSPSKERYEG